MRPCKGCRYEIYEPETREEPEYHDCKIGRAWDDCEIIADITTNIQEVIR